ncbi:MAG: DNA adenine methylase [Gemmatimonadota bacterium]|nr:DNA adenine methylase [Gemmatimonadota bacterium]
MASIRYIGSKARIANSILRRIGEPDGGVFIDAFCGTGAVAQAASRAGWDVTVNDHLTSSAIMAYARVISREDTDFAQLGGYRNAIAKLNALQPVNGFVWREYSPASSRYGSVSRMYFTEVNAQKIDAIRDRIRIWKDSSLINRAEENVLLADLMGSANQVANTAGTYGCFLSKWQRQSLDALTLLPRIIPKNGPRVTMTTVDVLKLQCKSKDTVYLDPPYTKRQYAAYYHILETIALGDEPKVKGVCGIRPWQDKASDYCYKSRAAKAIERLVKALPVRRIFLSYSTEGHVSLATLLSVLTVLGTVTKFEIDRVGRYRPNRAASEAASEVGEVLFSIEKADVNCQEGL